MILAFLTGATWWQAVPAYFLIGVVWAVLYLPRAITLQARAYRAWRDKITDGIPLATALSAGETRNLTAESFLAERDRQRFTERRIFTSFMLNIAFWPLRILEKMVFDFLRVALRWLVNVLADFWNKVVEVCRWISRTVRRWLHYVWRRVLAPAYRWAYLQVSAVYQSIISRANREAIADMKILDKMPLEKKA
jgi:hypothetical protein